VAAGKKSAAASLEKLSRGLTRETPATRAASETPQEAVEGSQREDSQDGGGASALGGGATTATRRGRPRTKPERMVRVSVDLSRADHKWLRDFAYEAESDNMGVMRALLQVMRDEPELRTRVLDRLGRKEL
jgi:hypothetical protein